MSDELFPPDSVAMISPRLAWIKKHGVRTHHSRAFEDAEWLPWCAAFGEPFEVINEQGDGALGFGQTEDEAIIDLAVKFDVKLWNEEGEFVA
jgi:hypothetical protein